MTKIKNRMLLLFTIIMSVSSFAQTNTDKIEMADPLFQFGKIYVVVGVIAIIFIGIIIYLISIDRKVSKLEKEIKAK